MCHDFMSVSRYLSRKFLYSFPVSLKTENLLLLFINVMALDYPTDLSVILNAGMPEYAKLLSV